PENFMSGITELRNGNRIFRREEDRFRTSIGILTDTIAAHDDTPPPPRRTQDRGAEAAAAGTSATGPPPLPSAFRNEPDTDPALPANRQWWAAHSDGETRSAPEPIGLSDAAAVDELVARARAASTAWREAGAEQRGRILLRAADIMGARRGDFLAVMADEVGKTPDQSDPEVSEAIDFLRYYALRATELEHVDGAAFAPDRVIVITPPWNFPVAIPTGSTVAALAVGASAIHKPSSPTPRCSALIIECLHDAGVPADVLQLVRPAEGDVGRALISHPDVDRVILTGASETATLFKSFRPDLPIAAETSGKNALVITPSADRDLAVADLVASAFGHAGQKCSAASLGILVGSVADSTRFRDQLIDAASSLIVGWPAAGPDGAQRTHIGAASMGPLTIEPEDKLLRALTTLEPGEEWLLEPQRLDETGRLWSPGIKTGVAPGSHFHLTEVFGPVLGLMRADSLDEAIELQNAVDFGLTAGVHSLDADEAAHWLDKVEAGNAYVNRGITGAIVQRQPFGGWKKSSVGLGSKAGGPRYLMQFGTWHDAADAPADPGAWLTAAQESDRRAWEAMGPADPTGMDAEANILRLLPRPVTVRVTEPVAPEVLTRLAHAAQTAGAPLSWSLSEAAAPTGVSQAVRTGTSGAVAGSGADAEAVVESADAFAARVAAGDVDDTVGARIRVVGAVEDALREATVERPEVAVLEGPVTGSGAVELRHYVHEQAVSMTLHRFGTPDRSFHALADRLR
ncbi:MAG TPA: aldehyde dehydrogenase family protein, partial [Brevibacterium sp.]|nr:aldehyde dehydrogenase family protein [Brevibacterium sp.]